MYLYLDLVYLLLLETLLNRTTDYTLYGASDLKNMSPISGGIVCLE